MNAWQSLLQQQGATLDDQGRLTRFADPGEGANAIAVCSHLGVLSVTGEEAETFLQGQVTADLRDMRVGEQRPAMHLSLKGRGLFSARVVRTQDGFQLVMARQLLPAARQALMKFVLRARVSLAPDDEAVVLRLDGPDAGQRLAAIYPDASFKAPALAVLSPSSAAELWPTLSQDAEQGGPALGDLLAIQAGDGQVFPGSEERFMPQELNYDLLEGVSFKKGCYVGQEVVARMHFKGKLKQRMRRLSWPATEAPAPGTSLRDDRDKSVADIVNAVVTGSRCQALAVIRHHYDQALFADGAALDWRYEALPYELPEE
jgi:folate-binding protein YgfZ